MRSRGLRGSSLAKSENLEYHRVLLKISGEAIAGECSCFSLETIENIVQEIAQVQNMGVEIGLVIGGGNIIRGERLAEKGLNRTRSDSMGMLATVINGMLFENIFAIKGVPSVLYSAIEMGNIAERMSTRSVERSLAEKAVIVFSGGTGNPFFTTDTAAALRACEIGANALLKATKVDGVYDRDPALHPDARFYTEISYGNVLKNTLKVMDMTAVSLCRENRIPIVVFNLYKRGNLAKIVSGERIGTIIKE